MRVLAVHAVGELVGVRLPHKGRAGVKQGVNDGRCSDRGRMGSFPVGIAATGHIPLNVEKILGREAQSRKRARGPAMNGRLENRAKGAERILGRRVGSSCGGHDSLPIPTMRRSAARLIRRQFDRGKIEGTG